MVYTIVNLWLNCGESEPLKSMDIPQNINIAQPSRMIRLYRDVVVTDSSSYEPKLSPTLLTDGNSKYTKKTIQKQINKTSCDGSVTEIGLKIDAEIDKVSLDEHDSYTEVVKRKTKLWKSRRNIGTAEIAHGGSGSGFKGEESKVWLYIYRIRRTSTEEDIRTFLRDKRGMEEKYIIVKEQPSQENMLKQFVVSAPLNKKDMYKSHFWPVGVGVKRFHMNRYQEYLGNGGGNF